MLHLNGRKVCAGTYRIGYVLIEIGCAATPPSVVNTTVVLSNGHFWFAGLNLPSASVSGLADGIVPTAHVFVIGKLLS
jgi:hypothetical protein